MNYYEARGTCNHENCGRFSKAQGADKEDATHMLMHEHGSKFKHAFDGEVVVVEVIDSGHSDR